MRLMLLLFIVLVTSACQNTVDKTPDPAWNENNAARIIVYRPKSDWMGAAVTFKVYADDVLLGSLTPGRHVSGYIPAGQSNVKVQAYFLGMPDGEPGIQELTMQQGETYHFRFTQYVDDFLVVSGMILPQGGLSLVPVNAEAFKDLK